MADDETFRLAADCDVAREAADALFAVVAAELIAVLPASADPGDSGFFSFSCLARSSAFVLLVNAMCRLSGDHTGLPAPLGKSVTMQ